MADDKLRRTDLSSSCPGARNRMLPDGTRPSMEQRGRAFTTTSFAAEQPAGAWTPEGHFAVSTPRRMEAWKPEDIALQCNLRLECTLDTLPPQSYGSWQNDSAGPLLVTDQGLLAQLDQQRAGALPSSSNTSKPDVVSTLARSKSNDVISSPISPLQLDEVASVCAEWVSSAEQNWHQVMRHTKHVVCEERKKIRNVIVEHIRGDISGKIQSDNTYWLPPLNPRGSSIHSCSDSILLADQRGPVTPPWTPELAQHSIPALVLHTSQVVGDECGEWKKKEVVRGFYPVSTVAIPLPEHFCAPPPPTSAAHTQGGSRGQTQVVSEVWAAEEREEWSGEGGEEQSESGDIPIVKNSSRLRATRAAPPPPQQQQQHHLMMMSDKASVTRYAAWSLAAAPTTCTTCTTRHAPSAAGHVVLINAAEAAAVMDGDSRIVLVKAGGGVAAETVEEELVVRGEAGARGRGTWQVHVAEARGRGTLSYALVCVYGMGMASVSMMLTLMHILGWCLSSLSTGTTISNAEQPAVTIPDVVKKSGNVPQPPNPSDPAMENPVKVQENVQECVQDAATATSKQDAGARGKQDAGPSSKQAASATHGMSSLHHPHACQPILASQQGVDSEVRHLEKTRTPNITRCAPPPSQQAGGGRKEGGGAEQRRGQMTSAVTVLQSHPLLRTGGGAEGRGEEEDSSIVDSSIVTLTRESLYTPHGMQFDDEWMLAQMMLHATSDDDADADAYDDNGDDAQEQHENEQHIPCHPEKTLGVRKEELTSTPRVPVTGGGGGMSEKGGGRSERGGGGGEKARRHWMVQHAINSARHGARGRERESQASARKEGGDSEESPDTTRAPPLLLVSEIELATDELIVF